MSAAPSYRLDRAAAARLAAAGRRALAWELVRRDPLYRSAWRSCSAMTPVGASRMAPFGRVLWLPRAPAEITDRFGLLFRRGSGAGLRRRAAAVPP